MEKQKTAITLMAVTFILLFIADLVTTISLGEAAKYLEANIIFKYCGFLGIIALNLIIIAVVYWLYNRSVNPTTRFYIINLLVTVCISRVFVVYNNFQVLLNPPTIQQAQQITQQQLTATAVQFLWLGLFVSVIPYLVSIAVFHLWKLDHIVDVRFKTKK